jgi:hypothetical protein
MQHGNAALLASRPVNLEGPAYVPGSAKISSFSIGRIILVKVPND